VRESPDPAIYRNKNPDQRHLCAGLFSTLTRYETAAVEVPLRCDLVVLTWTLGDVFG